MDDLVDRFQDDLRVLGVRAGGVLLVHSSLRSLGPVPGGARTVISGLLNVLGPEGTLLMPALSYEHVIPEHPYFDVNRTPANVGILPETFRLSPGVSRSVHPTHSVCALGPRASSLLEAHLSDTTPCGPHSPFQRLPEVNGQILFLGCGLQPNTSMHAVEELVVPPYLFDPPLEYHLTLANGSQITKSYTPHNFRGWQQRYERLEQVMESDGLREGSVLQAKCYLLDAGHFFTSALAVLRRDPLYFVSHD